MDCTMYEVLAVVFGVSLLVLGARKLKVILSVWAVKKVKEIAGQELASHDKDNDAHNWGDGNLGFLYGFYSNMYRINKESIGQRLAKIEANVFPIKKVDESKTATEVRMRRGKR